jgi:hypothetical protein
LAQQTGQIEPATLPPVGLSNAPPMAPASMIQAGASATGPDATQQASSAQPGAVSTPEVAGQLQVTIVEAAELRSTASDTYCICELGPRSKNPPKFQTPVVKNSRTPKWNHEHKFEKSQMNDIIHFSVWHKKGFFARDESLGKYSLALKQFFPQSLYATIPLSEGIKDAKPTLTVKLAVKKPQDADFLPPPAVITQLPEMSLAPASGTSPAPGSDPASSGQVATGKDEAGVAPNVTGHSGVATQESATASLLSNPGQTTPHGALAQSLVGAGQTTLGGIGPLLPPPPTTTMPLTSTPLPDMGYAGGTTKADVAPIAPQAFLLKDPRKAFEAQQAICRWIQYWDLRRDLPMDPQRLSTKLASPTLPQTHENRMFVLTLQSAYDLLVPLAPDARLTKSQYADARKAAEQEASRSLSLRLRFSFLDAPGGLAPALCGHSVVSPKLRIEKVEGFVQREMAKPKPGCMALCGPSPPKGPELGWLKVVAKCESAAPIFFCASTAGSDRQLVAEVFVEEEPSLLDPPVEPHVILPGETIRVCADGWLRYPEAKDKTRLWGNVAFTIDLKTRGGSIALRWAPLLDGEHVLRNSLVPDPNTPGSTMWGEPETNGGWPHQFAPPPPSSKGSRGGPVLLDFRRDAKGWEVWVDDERHAELYFADRLTGPEVVGVEFSPNFENFNPRYFIIPRETLPLSTTSKTSFASAQNYAGAQNYVNGVYAGAKWHAGFVTPKVPAVKSSAADLNGKGSPVTIGWMCIRFDNATETSRQQKGSQLRLGSLHDSLLPQLDPKGQLKQSSHNLHEFLQLAEGEQVGIIDYDLERVTIPPVAQKLLPVDFPAWVGMSRLGGIHSDMGSLTNMTKHYLNLNAADYADPSIGSLRITFPDGTWLNDLAKSVEFNVAGKMDKLASDEKKVSQLKLKVGTHNCLRWLDESIQRQLKFNKSQLNVPPREANPDESGNVFVLQLDHTSDLEWSFQGNDLPLEFVCDVDCAIVLELVAIITATKRGQLEASHSQTQTIGWLPLLPLVHTTEEALQQAGTSRPFATPVVCYNMDLMQDFQPPSRQNVFQWKPAQQGGQVPHNPVRISFAISGQAFLRWLQRRCIPPEVPEELKPKPRAAAQQPGSPSAQQKTHELLYRPTHADKDNAAVSSIVTQPQYPPPTIPQYPTLPGQQQPQMVTAMQPPWVHPAQVPSPEKLPPPELQTVVERIYLRDQGTQSDPPPIPGMEDQVIGEGRPLPAAVVAALASPPTDAAQSYTGPAMRPIPGANATRLIQDVGDSAANRILHGSSHMKTGAPRRELRWRLEDDDPLQADEITVEFLAYRSFINGFSERVHFQLRFFVFPPLKTSSAVLAGGVGEACMLRSSITNERLALLYNVDGATKGAASQVHRQLVEYLSARNAEVEVWSTDSSMQVGAVTIPLEPLVRQSQQVAKVQSELPVLDPMSGETRGSVQILLACRGQAPARIPTGLPTATSISLEALNRIDPMVAAGSGAAAVREVQAERGRVRRHKATAIMGTTAGISTFGGALFPDDAAKKRHRLKQLRMLRGGDATERFSESTALLSQAEEVRSDRKKAEVARRMDRFNTSQLTVLAPFANSTFFHIDFTNPYNQQVAFIVTISEPQKPRAPGVPNPVTSAAVGVPAAPPQAKAVNFQGILDQSPEEALVLVKDPQEWQRLVAEKKVPPPPGGEFAMFTALGHFTLPPGQSAFIPFRYLAFDHPSLSAAAQQAPTGGMSLMEAEAQTQDVPDRIFVIEVIAQQGPPLKRVEVTARAQPCVVDRTIRLFEAEGGAVIKELALPSRPAMSGVLRGVGQRVNDVGDYSTVRPTLGDIVTILSTDHTRRSNPELIGKSLVIVTDNYHSQPYQVQGSSTWLYPSDVALQAGFLATAVSRTSDRFVFCTDKEVHLQWKDDDTLQLRLLVPMSPVVKRFFVLCYADPNFMRVAAAQLVEIHAMKSEHVRTCVGQSVDRTISLPPVEVLDTAVVQAYSSDPEMVSVSQAASVDPRFGAKLSVTVTAMRAGTRTCRLHAVDPATRRRIAAYLIIVAADMPDIRMAHDITLPLNRPARKHLKYTNETMRPLRYTVKSSDPALVAVQTPELMLPAGDSRVVELLFHAYTGNMSYNTEVYLFIASEDRAIQETRLLQLTYT